MKPAPPPRYPASGQAQRLFQGPPAKSKLLAANIDECTAGTDPNDGADCLRALSIVVSGGTVTLRVAAKAGRRYKLQVSTLSAAKAELRKGGQYESLEEALAAARHTMGKIDPKGPHACGAEYFASNPGQQLRAWFSKDGVELASGIPTPEGEEATPY